MLQVKGVSKIKPQWNADKDILFKYFTFMGCLLSHNHRDKWHECNVTLRLISLETFCTKRLLGNIMHSTVYICESLSNFVT